MRHSGGRRGMIVAGRKDDRELRWQILRELEVQSLRGLRVRVDCGCVTLSGTVDSYGKQLAARDAAHRAAGSHELTDNVQVCLPGSSTRTDAELAAAVSRALEFDEFVPHHRIRVAVRQGRVALEGDVGTIWEREDTARVVRHVAGVRGIQNRIRIADPRLDLPPAHGPIERHA